MATALNLITLNPPGGMSCAPAGTAATTTTVTMVATSLQDGLDATDRSANPGALASAGALADKVNMLDRQLAPVSASLSDAVGLIDKYAAPITASLSDAFRAIDSYAPVTASLSDAFGVIDHYVSPLTAALTDLISVSDQLTASNGGVAAAAIAGLAVFGGLLVVRKERKRKR